MIRTRHILPFGLALCASSAALAQTKHDSNAPIDFDAQHIELQDKANRALLTGAVVIRQAEMTLHADRVNVTYTGQMADGSPQVSRLDAAGNVLVTRTDQRARSNYAIYDLNAHVITMVGAVTLTQGTNTVNGTRAAINLDTGRATVDSTAVPGGDSGVTSSNGRVTGRFSVPKRSQ